MRSRPVAAPPVRTARPRQPAAIPGEAANLALRIVAVGGLILSLLAVAGVRAALGGQLGLLVGFILIVQAGITAALLFAFAAMGDNLIAIRQLIERSRERPSAAEAVDEA